MGTTASPGVNLVDRLREAGVDIAPDRRLEGWDRVSVHHPFGNRLELPKPAAR